MFLESHFVTLASYITCHTFLFIFLSHNRHLANCLLIALHAWNINYTETNLAFFYCLSGKCILNKGVLKSWLHRCHFQTFNGNPREERALRENVVLQGVGLRTSWISSIITIKDSMGIVWIATAFVSSC